MKVRHENIWPCGFSTFPHLSHIHSCRLLIVGFLCTRHVPVPVVSSDMTTSVSGLLISGLVDFLILIWNKSTLCLVDILLPVLIWSFLVFQSRCLLSVQLIWPHHTIRKCRHLMKLACWYGTVLQYLRWQCRITGQHAAVWEAEAAALLS